MGTDFPWVPSVAAVLPEMLLLLLIFAVIFYDLLLKPAVPRRVGLLAAWGSFAILLVTLGAWLLFDYPTAGLNWTEDIYWGGMIRNDLVTLVFRVMMLAALTLTCLLSIDVERLQRREFYVLLITGTIGFSLMAASADLIMLYLALETASISLYALAGFSLRSQRSVEAGMKYFVYGAFSSAIMLYGMSLLYGVLGMTNIYQLADFVVSATQAEPIPPAFNGVFLLSAVMIVTGFGFKISAVPFHFWTPDVYEGAPSSVVALLSTASKAAGFAVFLRVFAAGVFGTPDFTNAWWAMLVAMTVVTMTLGNFLAIFQSNIKRMLAYSSIAQAGYTMIGLVTLTPDGSGAALYYLLMYVFTNIAAFGVVILVSNRTGSDNMEDFYGLSRRSPYLALAMLLALLSLGGIPPTAGFFGKFFIFKAAVDAGLWWLALIGVLNAFIGLYYYLSVVKYMYLYRSEEEEIAIPMSRAAKIGLALSVLGIIYLGVIANPAFEWTRDAGGSFFLQGLFG